MLNHLAIIMDGNGRWAEARKLPRSAGHKKGAETAEAIIRACPEHGIKHLTLYTFSSENWNRPENEVSDLMNLLRYYLKKELGSIHKNGVRVKAIGDLKKLPEDIQNEIKKAEETTSKNTRLNLNIAISYGSRQEIINAVKETAKKAKEGSIKIESITEEIFSNSLYTKNIPDPDLLIRTGGEHRISNYLLWQMAYTEFYFTDTLWPDFTAKNLAEAVEDFSQRERRYGTTRHQEAV